MASFKPTPSQQAAIDAFQAFLLGQEQVFMLKGAAGTGKTTIVAEFIQLLESAKRDFALMAPTGRAAYIIGCKTAKSATTIHRGIYALSKVRSNCQNNTENDGGLHARFGLKKNEASESALYIIDESSMISDSFSEHEAFSFGSGRLLTDLFTFAQGRKIVFVGDYAQLPPVGMNFSPALDKKYLEQTFNCKVSEVILREVMRQQSASIMLYNANAIRNCIDNKTFIEFNLKNGTDFESEHVDLLQPYFKLSDSKPDIHSAIIAYSNQQALRYNVAVRRHYFGATAPRLKSGDLLMIARNNYAYEHELFNGNIVMVESCVADEDVESRIVKVKLDKNRVESITLRFRAAVLKFNTGGVATTINVKLLDSFLDDPHGTVGGLVAQALVIDFENHLPKSVKEQLPQIKKLLRSKDKLTPDQQALCDSYINLLWQDPYYNAVICKYGYAMTCHKAQGGEWENVFVDMGRFGSASNETYFRWAYTALTRASKKIWHYHSPDFNYISKLVVEPIQESANIKVSTYSDKNDFCQSRFERIKTMAEKSGLSVSEDKSKNFQHRISFSDSEHHSSLFSLWYNKNGYSNKDILLSSNSDELAAISQSILEASYRPESVPFKDSTRPFAEKLVAFLKSQFLENGIHLLDITHEQFQDIFHLKTDGYAKVYLYYTDKGNYTYMKLISSLGEADGKLAAFREKFI